MRTIGIISDTQGGYDQQFTRFFRDCDELWHCGDFGSTDTLLSVLRIGKRVLGVRGECDVDPIYERTFKTYRVFTLEGIRFLVVHKAVDNTLSEPALYGDVSDLVRECRPDCIVCGHTERHLDRVLTVADGDSKIRVRILNPGAVSPRKHNLQTALKIRIDGGAITSVERMELVNSKITIK